MCVCISESNAYIRMQNDVIMKLNYKLHRAKKEDYIDYTYDIYYKGEDSIICDASLLHDGLAVSKIYI